MQCGEHQVSRDSRADSDIGCLAVTDLTDHDYIGVLTEYGTQGCREGHTCFFVHLALVYAVYLLFDRVLGCNYVYVRL